MVKNTQTIRPQYADKLFEFDDFVGLALNGLINPFWTNGPLFHYIPVLFFLTHFSKVLHFV